MDREGLEQRLSQISTVWTLLRQLHEGPADEARAALQLLVERYRGAVYRYLLRLLGDAGAADDLTQEFALELMRGGFRHASPRQGRFRAYVKSALFHLVSRFRKRQQKLPRSLDAAGPELDLVAAPAPDPLFDEAWRDELLARTWDALAQAQKTFHTVLRLSAPEDMTAAEIAALLGRERGKVLTPDSVRKTLQRAREKFADLLLEQVAHSLAANTIEEVEDELRALGLLDYCRPALERRAAAGR